MEAELADASVGEPSLDDTASVGRVDDTPTEFLVSDIAVSEVSERVEGPSTAEESSIVEAGLVGTSVEASVDEPSLDDTPSMDWVDDTPSELSVSGFAVSEVAVPVEEPSRVEAELVGASVEASVDGPLSDDKPSVVPVRVVSVPVEIELACVLVG